MIYNLHNLSFKGII